MSEVNAARLDEILLVATEAAVAAGEVLMSHFGRLEASEIRSKSERRDLVTKADLESERLLVKRLRASYPDHAIEAEEETKDRIEDPDQLRWFLDPLDGTINFVHGLPCFAVSMGLYRGAEPLVGVVHVPRLDETFTARRGGGAFLNGRGIRVSGVEDLRDAILGTGFPYRRNELLHNNLANFNRVFYDVRGVRRMGAAAVDLAFVAAGRLDGFWELHLSPHDMAAGALLVREAGGIVTDVEGGDAWLRGGHIVASGAGVHGAIRSRVEQGEGLRTGPGDGLEGPGGVDASTP